jgi:diguanylate cyclase (GGDEF)-like protein
MPASWLQRKREEHGDEDGDQIVVAEPAPRKHGLDDKERERQLHGLAVLSLFLHSTATIEEMMGMLLEQAPTVTGATLVYPLLLDRKRQLLRASAIAGTNDTRLEAAMEAFQEDLAALEFSLLQNQDLYSILEEGEVAIRDSFSALMSSVLPDEQWKAAEEKMQVRRLAFVPMVVENEPLGMVVFVFDRDDIDVEALELLVGHLTLALRDMLLRDEATRFADVDPVTWVFNRRRLLEALDHEIVRAGRYGRALSLVTLDIDGFGQFNANFGQSMGDKLLRSAATTLAETVSPPELVARLKDDDFAVLLPETNRASAVETTTRLLSSLTQVSVFSAADEDADPVTFSVAIACFPEDGSTPLQLLASAQAALDASKRDRHDDQRPRMRRPVDPMARASGQR